MPSEPDRPANILRLPDVRHRVRLSRSTIYARSAAGTFPPPIAIGPNSVGWIESEIDDWIAERIAERDAT